MSVLKEKLTSLINNWNTEIDTNSNSQKLIDIDTAFEDLFYRHIVHICFGEDVSDMQIEMEFPKQNTRKKVSLAEAIYGYNASVTELSTTKWLHPAYQAIRRVTGIKHLTSY